MNVQARRTEELPWTTIADISNTLPSHQQTLDMHAIEVALKLWYSTAKASLGDEHKHSTPASHIHDLRRGSLNLPDG